MARGEERDARKHCFRSQSKYSIGKYIEMIQDMSVRVLTDMSTKKSGY